MVKKEKTIYEEHWLLPLLKKQPTYESNEIENEKSVDEIKEAVNHILGFFEKEEQIDTTIAELKDQIKELGNDLRRHKHLKDGTAVGRI